MRIVWIDINSSYSHSSLTLPLLHAAAAGSGSGGDWQAVSATTNDQPGVIAARAAALEPDIVAGTLWLFTHPFMLRVLRRVKALRPDCRIILGGPEFLGDNEPFLRREPMVTAVCRGEGENSFVRWLAVWRQPAAWNEIAGLCWIDATGLYHDNGSASLDAVTLNRLPSPEASPFFTWDKPFVQLETARGCSQDCRFCTSCRTGPPRLIELDRVRRFLGQARGHGVREVRVLDRTFNALPGRAAELLDLFQREFGDLEFHLEIHPAFLPPRLRAALAAARPGQLFLEVGLQTSHPAALAACDRGGDPAAAWDGLAFLCSLRHLQVHVDLLSGLPELTLAHLLTDLQQVIRLGPAEIQLEVLKILPGTPFRGIAHELGMVFAPEPPYEVLRTPQMPEADLETARQLSFLVDAFYNHPALQPAIRELAGVTAGFLPEFLKFIRSRADLEPGLSLEKRFHLLDEFVRLRTPQPAGLIQCLWLKAGLSPAHGIAAATAWKKPLPADAERVEGRADFNPAACRIWHLSDAVAETWFVYDRRQEPSRPVAIFRRPY